MTYPNAFSTAALTRLLDVLSGLREEIQRNGSQHLRNYPHVRHDAMTERSASNLAQYVALHRHDLQGLQDQLALHGLSSLGHCEGHVLHSLDTLCRALELMTNAQGTRNRDNVPSTVTPTESSSLLASRTRLLFGENANGRPPILVTLTAELGEDARLCSRLVDAGMDCARIDCAHDSAETWQRIIANVRAAAAAAGRTCSILMDLAGPKPRTGPIAAAPSVAHIKPSRDAIGRPVGPAEILLLAHGTVLPESAPRCHFEIPETLAAELQVGDRLGFVDTRGKSRELLIVDRPATNLWMAHAFQAAWLTPETNVHLLRRTHKGGLRPQPGEYRFNGFAPRTQRIRVHTGDSLLLSYDASPGEPERFDANGRSLQPARIGCLECSTLDDVALGDPVWIDGGRIGAEVVERRDEGLMLRITHTRTPGQSIKSGHSLDFPHSRRALQALSDKVLADVHFAAGHADVVALPFTEEQADLERLFTELHSHEAGHLGIVVKIANARAVDKLPDLLLTTLGRHPLALMIEGENLATRRDETYLPNIMNKTLSLAAAAHTPVIWSTQAFDTLVKEETVVPSELGTTAIGQRAQCITLNSGPNLLEALHTLDRVLRRSERQRWKNTPPSRSLMFAGNECFAAETGLADSSARTGHPAA